MLTTPDQELLRLLPLIIPLAGAAVTIVAGSFVPARIRSLFVAASAAGCLVSVLALWTGPTWRIELQTLPPTGAPTLAAPVLHLAPGPWTILAALLVTTTALLASLATLGFRTSRGSAILSLLSISACLGACVSANILTLFVFWVMLDLALLGFNAWSAFSPTEIGRGWWRATVNYLAGLALLGILLFQTQSGEAVLDQRSRLALSLAALVRIGVYPFPFPISVGGRPPIASAVITQAASMTFGSLLLARLSADGLPMQTTAVTALAAGVLVTALLAWQEQDPYRLLHRVAANQAVIIAMAFYLTPPGDTGLAALLLVNFAICLACIVGDTRYVPYGEGLRDLLGPLIALASLGGIPGTAGFAARWRLTSTALPELGSSIALVTAISNALILAPLIRRARFLWSQPHSQTEVPSWASRTALWTLMAMGFLILFAGFFPSAIWLLAAQALPSAGGAASAIDGEPSSGALFLLTLFIPLAGGYLGHRVRLSILRQLTPVTAIAAEILDLAWVHRALQWLTQKGRSVLRGGAKLIEQGLYLAWTLAWVLVLLFWLFGEV
jgi:formate hydrogenlyase subunit 3/multisubunit Na+/H+ antiporter MnhD subunit